MTRINDNGVNNTAEYNLLHDIVNPPKRTKKLNIHYSTIIHGCMNTRKGKARFKKFRILLDSGFSPTTVMGRPFEKLILEKML